MSAGAAFRIDVPRVVAWAWRGLGFWVGLAVACFVAGAFYGAISGGRPWVGAAYGFAAGFSVMPFERGALLPGLRARLRRMPLVPGVMLTEATYLMLIMAGNAVVGAALWSFGGVTGSLGEAMLLKPVTILYALVVSGVIITLLRMRDLIGADVFRNVILGRYYHPVEEERIFLFIDLIGSTAYAQVHGDLRAQAFLGAIFAAMAEPVRRFGGTIDDYIGDMAMVTWPMAAGVADGRCIACVFAFLAAIERDVDTWQGSFGQVPRFRAALHGGRVVTADVGVDRHKIAYFGDVVNATGRMEALCRTLDAALLVSSDLMARMSALPGGIVARPLGAHGLKGRGQMPSVLALEATGAVQRAGAVAA